MHVRDPKRGVKRSRILRFIDCKTVWSSDTYSTLRCFWICRPSCQKPCGSAQQGDLIMFMSMHTILAITDIWSNCIDGSGLCEKVLPNHLILKPKYGKVTLCHYEQTTWFYLQEDRCCVILDYKMVAIHMALDHTIWATIWLLTAKHVIKQYCIFWRRWFQYHRSWLF